ncbi:MAG: ATP-binding protein [Candidatus Falkowbacteria bacterium]
MTSKLNLNRKIFWSSFAIILGCGLILAIIVGVYLKDFFAKQNSQALVNQTKIASDNLSDVFNGYKTDVFSLSQNSEIIAFSSDWSPSRIDTIEKTTALLTFQAQAVNLAIIDVIGQVRYRSKSSLEDEINIVPQLKIIPQTPTIIASLPTGKTEVVYYFVAPIKNSDALVGAIILAVDSKQFHRQFAIISNTFDQNDFLFVDENGVVVESARPEFQLKSIGPLSQDELNRLTAEHRFGDLPLPSLQYNIVFSEIKSRGGTKLYNIFDQADGDKETLVVSHVNNTPFSLLMEIKEGAYGHSNVLVLLDILALILIAALFEAFLVYVAASRLLKPVGELRRVADSLSQNHLADRAKILSGDELEDVGLAFNRVAERLGHTIEETNQQVETQTKDLRLKQQELANQKAAALNILSDIAEEKDKTQLEKDKFALIISSIGDGVLVVDESGKILIFNHAAEQISGFVGQEIIGKPFEKFFILLDDTTGQRVEIIREVLHDRQIRYLSNQAALIHCDGRRIPIADSAAPILDAHGEIAGCIMVFRDATKEREIDRQKNEFVSVASHQLRTPLTSIKWYLEMLLDGDMGRLNPDQKEALTLLTESNERLIDLVNRLLNVSRIEAGKVKLDPKPSNLPEIIKTIIIEDKAMAEKYEVKMVAKIEKLPIIELDPGLIREVISNLITNAIKYTPANGKVTVRAKIENDQVLVSVADSGIGIPQADQVKIFRKFYRATNAVAKETEGTGMGLCVAKSIVELSGGKIWFESIENQGTTFYFTLPVKRGIIIKENKGLI